MKPSDSPERRRDRVRRHRQRAVDNRIAQQYIDLGRDLPPGTPLSAVIDRMIAEDFANIDLVADQVRYDLDLLDMLAERWGISGFLRCKPHRLALVAYEADRARVEREERQRASKAGRGWERGVWTGARAGEPWGNRFDNSRRRTFDLSAPDFSDFVELWGLNKRIRRFAPRRRLRLKTGKLKWFEIAIAASGVRRPPPSAFEAKRTFPAARQWYQRWDWPESWPEAKPARDRPPTDELVLERGPQRFLWTRAAPLAGAPSVLHLKHLVVPPSPWDVPTGAAHLRGPASPVFLLLQPTERGIRLVCSDYPKGWAAESLRRVENTPLELRAAVLREKSARIREHSDLMRGMYEISEAFEASLRKPLQSAA